MGSGDWRIDPKVSSPTGGVAIADEVHLPGWGGFPFRGQPGLFKATDPISKQPREGIKMRACVFDMANEEQAKAYNAAIQVIYNGWGTIHKEESKYDEVTKNWKIFLVWGELFTYNPLEH